MGEEKVDYRFAFSYFVSKFGSITCLTRERSPGLIGLYEKRTNSRSFETFFHELELLMNYNVLQ